MNGIQTAVYASPAVEMKCLDIGGGIGNAWEENRRNIEAKGRGNDNGSTRCKERKLKKKSLPETNDALQEVSFKGSR